MAGLKPMSHSGFFSSFGFSSKVKSIPHWEGSAFFSSSFVEGASKEKPPASFSAAGEEGSGCVPNEASKDSSAFGAASS